MKAQMSGKICSFKLIKTFFFFFFLFECDVSFRRNRHSLATLIFSEVAPHFPK